MTDTVNSRLYKIADTAIKIGVVFVATLISVGYIMSTYFPELSFAGIAIACLVGTVIFALPAMLGAWPSLGWLFAAAGLLISFFALGDFYRNLPHYVYLKAVIIVNNIVSFSPDYLASDDMMAELALFVAIVLAVLVAYFYTRCFFRGKAVCAYITVLATTALSFIGIERANPLFLMLSVGLFVLIHSVGNGFMRAKRTALRLVSLTLALLISAAALSVATPQIKQGSAVLAERLRLDALEQLLKTGELPDDLKTPFLPSETGQFDSVGMNDIEYANIPVFYVTLPYNTQGLSYLKTASYYDYNNGIWTTPAPFSFRNDSMIYKNIGRVTVTAAADVDKLPFFVNSSNPIFYTDENGRDAYSAVAYVPYSPTSDQYIRDLYDWTRTSQKLPSDAESQLSVSDVDFNALATEARKQYADHKEFISSIISSTLSVVPPPTSEGGETEASVYFTYSISSTIQSPMPTLAEDIRAVAMFLSEMRYNATPTKSSRFAAYDDLRSPIYNFIYNTKEGYCVHFATTAALLLRAMGYETRYCTGYCFTADKGGSATVLDSNSHAWIEIYLGSLGWVTLEMTPGGNRPANVYGFAHYETSAEESTSSEPPAESEEAESEEEVSEESAVFSEQPDDDESSALTEDSSYLVSDAKPESEAPQPDGFAVIPAVVCAVILLVCVAFAAFCFRAVSCAKAKRSELERLRSVTDDEAADAVRRCWRFVIGLFDLLGEDLHAGTDSSGIKTFAEAVKRTNPDMPCLADVLDIFLAAEFGTTATARDAALCVDYALSLNDYTAGKLSPAARLAAYARHKLLPVPKRQGKD